MLPRQALRGVMACRQLAVSRPLLQKLSPWSVQSRFYSKEGENTNGGNTNGNGTNGANTNGKAAEAAKPDVETPEKIIEKLKTQLEEAKHEMMLVEADRRNSVRIAKDDVRKAKEYGLQKFATSLLDVNDILERALSSVTPAKLESNPELKSFHEGVQMTERLILKVYEQNDIKKFTPMGEKFDPNKHQALQEVPDPSKEAGTVCYVMKSGYQLKDRLLRPASVAVVKAPPQAQATTPNENKEETAQSS